MSSVVAAAVLYVWVYFANSFPIIPSFNSPFRCSPSVLPTGVWKVCYYVFKGSVTVCGAMVLQCMSAYVYEAVCVSGNVSSVRTAVNTAGVQLPSRERGEGEGAGQDRAEGAGGRRGAALLIPQDGVLVVKLQMLHRGATAGLLSTAVPVFHHLKGLLHFSVLACLHMLGGGQ